MNSTCAARWVFPVSSPPIPDGVVEVCRGEVVAIHPAGRLTPDVHLGNWAILPGLVNPHTHLDLTGASGKILPNPNAPFTDWLQRVIAFRRSQQAADIVADYLNGLESSRQAGVQLLGDISAVLMTELPQESLADIQPEIVTFRELLGLSQSRAELAIQAACDWLHDVSPTQRVFSGLSPHAPYSVRESLMVSAGQLCRQYQLPLALHLAESPEELDLLAQHRGPMVDFLTNLGVYDPTGLVEDPSRAMWAVDGGQPKLFIHCNYLDPRTEFPPRSSVIYCPRTQAAFWPKHRHPVHEFLKRGVNVALGTDSLASNPDLDPLQEACFLRQINDEISGEELLNMITRNGARALGHDAHHGSIQAGRLAKLIAVELPDRDEADPHELLFRPGFPRAARRKLFRDSDWTSSVRD